MASRWIEITLGIAPYGDQWLDYNWNRTGMQVDEIKLDGETRGDIGGGKHFYLYH
ncbi:hypothetical protein HB364_02375 [Pseudoflavitalea sp. X16]|uniref:hypothetical protein n=1 Tax=Paraflavitalea devenefica TaxID=2716334 RepID=UPI001424275A|nr:hypothetical protein [Paraflavitalea devenefica]NII23909.1 hypothetical protein [Paraflavitalea devenefica]